MTDVIERLTAADPELGRSTGPVKPPAGLLASITDGTDVVLAVPEIDPVSSPRRPRTPLVAALAGFAAVLVVGAVTFLAIDAGQGGSGGEVTSGDTNALITSEMILEDGVVTEEEYRAGVEAVVVCLGSAGFESVVDYDNPNGSASFSGGSNEPMTLEESINGGGPYMTAFEQCLDVHLSNNVSLGWAVTLGQLDLDELREETTAVVECVESRTGEDFGELNYNRFGYLTRQGQQTSDAAFEYQDHQPWTTCQNDLGYLDDARAETKAIFECVEKRTGQDFGELTYDDFGMLTEDGRKASRAAATYQNDVPWINCVEAIAVVSDGVFYFEEATEITEINGLTLVVQESNIGPCLEVRTDGGMAGGCGGDFDEPLSVGTGGIDGMTFASGWAPSGTAKVEMTYPGGEVVEATTFETADGYDIVFFVVPLTPSLGDEPPLPLQVVAYDDQGNTLATVSYADGFDSDPQLDH